MRRYGLLLLLTASTVVMGCSSPEPTTVGIHDLYSEYLEDEAAADAQYGGRMLRVTGVVSVINGQQWLGETYIGLLEREQTDHVGRLEVVLCFFRDESVLAAVSKDDEVTVEGRCRGFVGQAVQLEDCSMVSREYGMLTSRRPH